MGLLKDAIIALRKKKYVFITEKPKEIKGREFWNNIIVVLVAILITTIGCIYKEEIKSFFKLSYRQEYNKMYSNLDIKLIEESLNIEENNYKWNNKLTYTNKPVEIIYHHAADTSMTALEAHELHLKNGWEGIGYQFFITKDGVINRGRPESAEGAHTKGENNHSIGICLEGNFEEEYINDKQREALINLSIYICLKYDINNIVGHKDLGNTLCPGANTDIKEIRNRVLEGLKDFNMDKFK